MKRGMVGKSTQFSPVHDRLNDYVRRTRVNRKRAEAPEWDDFTAEIPCAGRQVWNVGVCIG